jgi:hypothetical protein
MTASASQYVMKIATPASEPAKSGTFRPRCIL